MIAPGLGHAMIAWLLRNSAGAALVALLVLFVQWMLGKRISARWRHNLWLLVIVRLVLPPLPAVKIPAIPHLALIRPLIRHLNQTASPIAVTPPEPGRPAVGRSVTLARKIDPLPDVLPLPPRDVGASVPDSQLASVAIDSIPLDDFREAQAPGERPVLPGTLSPARLRVISERNAPRVRLAGPRPKRIETTRAIPWAQIFVGTWGLVTLGLVLKTLVGSLRVERAVRKLRIVREPALVDLVRDCARLLKLPRPPVLLEGPAESGPALVGFWRPKLLLPVCVLDQFTWREVRHVVLHELVHLRRGDILVNYLTSVALAVHWFNPLVWLTAARMRAERELACDEAVLALTPWREGRAYGSTIVKLLELLSGGAVPAGAMGVIGHKALMHRRIAMIARFDGSRRHWSASAILLSTAVAGAALAGVVRAQVQPPPGQQAVATATDQPAQPSDANEKDNEAKTADEPSGDVKPEASNDEANAQQAVRAEAERNDAGPAADAPPPTAHAPDRGAFIAGGPLPPTPPPAANLAVSAAAPPAPSGPAAGPDNASQRQWGGSAFGGGMQGGGFGGGGTMASGGMMPGAGAFGGGIGSVGQPQFATIEDAVAVKADAKTLEKLQRPIPMEAEGESLEDVLNMLAQKGGFDVLIDNRALGEVHSILNVQMNIRDPQPIEQLLQFVLRQAGGDEIGFSVVHGVVLVSSKVQLDRHAVTRVYDVGDLGSQQDIATTVFQTIAPTSLGKPNLSFLKGKLIVTTSEPNQREIAKLLAMLRQDGPHADAGGAAPQPGQKTTVTGEEVNIYQLRRADARDAAKTIQSKLGGPGLSISSDPRTNSVLVAGSKSQVKEARALIKSIDAGNDPNDRGATPTEPPPANR